LPGLRYVLSFSADALPARTLLPLAQGEEPILLLSGPEGGLDEVEEALVRHRGFSPLSLGPRVLRADTAPLAALALLGVGG
jgi:16S rRNA (uracil1498-N3)-methyltransferase